MGYTINHYNGSTLVEVPDAFIDSTTCDVKLIGKNYAGYGEAQNENFVFLLENFASNTAPAHPIPGQIWYDSATKKIKFYDSNTFISTARIEVCEPTPPTNNRIVGDFWFNTVDKQLFAWDGADFILVGPEQSSTAGVTKMLATKVKDTTGVDHVIIKAMINDNTVFTISSDPEFTLNSLTPIPGFTTIHSGTTLVNTVNGVTNNLIHRYWGTASNADKLDGLDASAFHPKSGSSSESFTANDLTLYGNILPNKTYNKDIFGTTIQPETTIYGAAISYAATNKNTSGLVVDCVGGKKGLIQAGVNGVGISATGFLSLSSPIFYISTSYDPADRLLTMDSSGVTINKNCLIDGNLTVTGTINGGDSGGGLDIINLTSAANLGDLLQEETQVYGVPFEYNPTGPKDLVGILTKYTNGQRGIFAAGANGVGIAASGFLSLSAPKFYIIPHESQETPPSFVYPGANVYVATIENDVGVNGVGLCVSNTYEFGARGYFYAGANGSVAVGSEEDLAFMANAKHKWKIGQNFKIELVSSTFQPATDDSTGDQISTVSLGSASSYWEDIYANNSHIAGSDSRKKTDIVNSDLGLDFILNLRPVSYKWIVGEQTEVYNAETDKTESVVVRPGIRPHYGFIAQEVKEVLGEKDFAGYIYNEEADMYGLRYSEFIAPIIKAVQEMKTEYDSIIAELRQEIANLKAS